MPSRLQKARPRHVPKPSREYIHQDSRDDRELAASDENYKAATPQTPNRTMNSKLNGATMEEARYNPYANSPKSVNGKIPSTIRTVPSFEAPSDSSSESPSARNSGFSSSINSNASGTSYLSQPLLQEGSAVRSTGQSPSPDPRAARLSNVASSMSSNSTLKASTNGAAEAPFSSQVGHTSPAEEQSPSPRDGLPQWDGTVGKAALGKTGRVINKLVTENEALKRDIKIERMKSEESKQAAKLMEDKMERMVSDYESRLLEANVTKTLLSRKERQVEHLQATVELEKKRTAEALERERTWREEMEKSRRDAGEQVEEAKTHAALMEGRYNAIASHWQDQGNEVKRATASVRAKIASLVAERQSDDAKINTLRELCDQQESNIRDLKRQKDDIGQQFENYKREQEDALRYIKTKADERETLQERTLAESQKVLGELKWALNVNKNVPGAR